MSLKNRQVLLASRPKGEPTPENFRLVEAEVPRPGAGQMLLRTLYLSLDPYMRGRMNAGPSYARPVEVGEVMEGRAVAEVIESNLNAYKPGDVVFAPTGWQEYALSDGKEARKLDASLGPASYALGVLGMPGQGRERVPHEGLRDEVDVEGVAGHVMHLPTGRGQLSPRNALREHGFDGKD